MNILDQLSFKMDGPAYNTWSCSHNMQGKMPIISLNKLEIGPSMMPTVEDITRKLAKPSDKPVTSRIKHILKISQHPLYNNENYSTKEANTLIKLWNNINDDKYGPWWFEFLSRAIDYDCHLFDWSSKTKQTLKHIQNKRNQAIKKRDNAIQKKENIIQEHLNVQKLLSSAQIEVEKLLQKNKTLTSHLPSQQYQGCSCSRIRSVTRLPSQDHISFGKKTHYKEHWNQSYISV